MIESKLDNAENKSFHLSLISLEIRLCMSLLTCIFHVYVPMALLLTFDVYKLYF